MGLEEQENLAKANKQVEKEYLKNIRKELSLFPCFLQKDCLIYSTKLWYDLKKEYSHKAEDIRFEFLVKAINKSMTYMIKEKECFKVYRYILTVVRNIIKPDDKGLDEGDFL